MEINTNPTFLLEITQEQKFTVSVEAENELQAIELVNCEKGHCECEFPPELLVKKTRIIKKV